MTNAQPDAARETRHRRRIRQAVESRGYRAEQIDWEPWSNGGEKSGIYGGWTVTVDRPYLPNLYHGADLHGLSVDEVLADIDYWLKPSEPCGCNLAHHAALAAGIVNDPQVPTHSAECRWHIRYRLPWWNRPE